MTPTPEELRVHNDFAIVRSYLPQAGKGWAPSQDAIDRIDDAHRALLNERYALLAEVARLKAGLLSVHDLASARLNGANKLSPWEYWEHDMREIERLSREG